MPRFAEFPVGGLGCKAALNTNKVEDGAISNKCL